jgi:two-component system, OmpR family, phosphate regulon sensor histidine kinase PhoR
MPNHRKPSILDEVQDLPLWIAFARFSSSPHEWLAYLMHDLRDPLGRISRTLHLLDLLASGENDPNRKELIEIGQIIRRELTEADALIAGIASHITLENSAPRFEKISLGRLLEQLLVRVQPDLAAKEIELDYRPPHDALCVPGDAGLLGRVFQNLIGNAIEYTPRYGFIGIEGTVLDGKVCVAISDSGTGVPESALHWLFEPGFRIESRPMDALDGRGLGLAFVRRVVDMHHGQVSVEPRSEEGSCFVVELPANEDPPLNN